MLKGLGDASIGIITVAHYDYNHDSAMNKAFVKGFREISGGRNPDIFSIGGYDGMHLIYEALKKTGGKADGDSLIEAAKGMKWESPRGPMSIDPETRDVVQTIYVRRVDKVGDGLENVEFDKVEDVKDPVKAADEEIEHCRLKSARRAFARGRRAMRQDALSENMHARTNALLGLGALAAACLPPARRCAQHTIKIGLIMPYSGQFADTATQMDNAIKLYVKQHGDTVAGRKIEFIRKDTGGIAPDVAKRLAQELVVRDKVDILAGFVLTPNAMAAGDVSAEAKKFMVVMNAATAIITTKSPYMARTSITLPQMTETLGTWAAQGRHQEGLHDGLGLRPGPRRRRRVPARLQGGGRRDRRLGALPGRQPGLLRLRAARQGPQSGSDLHLRARRRAAGRHRQGAGRARHRSAEDQDPRQGELTEDEARKSMGDAALGIITVYHYDHGHDSALNKTFVTAFKEAYGGATRTSTRSAAMTACT